jgi:hypothetical protein
VVAQFFEALTQETGDQQRCRESLCWIARANSPALFLYEFSDRHRFPHSRYTAEFSKLARKRGRVTEDIWQVACFGKQFWQASDHVVITCFHARKNPNRTKVHLIRARHLFH